MEQPKHVIATYHHEGARCAADFQIEGNYWHWDGRVEITRCRCLGMNVFDFPGPDDLWELLIEYSDDKCSVIAGTLFLEFASSEVVDAMEEAIRAAGFERFDGALPCNNSVADLTRELT